MDIYQQIKQTIDEVQRIIICLPSESNIDNIAAGLALGKVLDNFNKTIEIVSDNFLAVPHYKFLNNIESIKPYLPPLKQLVISLDLKNSPLGEFSYDVKNNQLEIYLEPKKGIFDETSLKAKKIAYKYELIITLGVVNLESLGQIFNQAPDFFYTVPLINIDCNPNNERFGQINCINLTSVANSELTHELLNEIWGEELINKEIATYLLTGIINKTNGLKSSQITPSLLNKVSKFINLGVDVAEINKNLFHNLSLNMLKLWGRVLARLKQDKEIKLIWSLIPYEDFIKTKTSDKELARIINELLETYDYAELILLLWQNHNKSISGLLKTTYKHNAFDLLASFSPQGSADLVEFSLDKKNLLEAEQIIINNLRQKINI